MTSLSKTLEKDMVENGSKLDPYEAMLHARRISKFVDVSHLLKAQGVFKSPTGSSKPMSPPSQLVASTGFNSSVASEEDLSSVSSVTRTKKKPKYVFKSGLNMKVNPTQAILVNDQKTTKFDQLQLKIKTANEQYLAQRKQEMEARRASPTRKLNMTRKSKKDGSS